MEVYPYYYQFTWTLSLHPASHIHLCLNLAIAIDEAAVEDNLQAAVGTEYISLVFMDIHQYNNATPLLCKLQKTLVSLKVQFKVLVVNL